MNSIIRRLIDVAKKSYKTNPIVAAKLKKKKEKLEREEEIELPKGKLKAKDEPIAEFGDYEISTPIWRYEKEEYE